MASDLLCLLVLRIWRPLDVSAERDVFFLTRGLGPIAISWLLYHLFLIFPQRTPSIYVFVVAAVFAAVFLLGRQQIRQLATIYAGLAAALRCHWPLPPLSSALLCLVTGIALFIVIIGVTFPIVEGDALGFAIEARLIHRDLSFAHYPTLSADPQTGYYYDTFQVPCLQMLYVWFDLLTGTSQLDILPRTVAPMYAIECVLILCWVLFRRSRNVQTALWGGLALIAVPVFASESYFNGQDAHRIYFSFCALVLLDIFLLTRSLRQALLLALFVGLAIYSHFFGLLTLLAVLLLYLCLGDDAGRRKVAVACLITVTALFVGAAHHYARPAVVPRVLLQFPALAPYLDTLLTRLGTGHVYDTPDLQSVYDWMAARRGQESWLKQVLFAKLQPLTGIEWFGLSFWIFSGAVILWLWRAERTRLEKILFGSGVIYALAVLSDVRVMASSNPRYIATALPVCAYFTGLLASALLDAMQQRAGRLAYGLTAVVAIVALVIPLVAFTAVRGAKVGITNPGGVYVRLRSTEWAGLVASHPLRAFRAVWDHYLGIKDTLKYFWASDEEKLEHAHDSFAAIAYVNSATRPEASALVFRVTRYFYYAQQRKGVSYVDPRLEALARMPDRTAACEFLCTLGVDHVVFDSYFETYPLYRDTKLADILKDPTLSKKVYEYGSAQVYKLSCVDARKSG